MSEKNELKNRIDNSRYDGIPTAQIRDDYGPVGKWLINRLCLNGEYTTRRVVNDWNLTSEWRIFKAEFKPYQRGNGMSESEAQVEKYLHKCVEEMGGTTRKWVSPQHSGVPDRILFHPDRYPFFIEVKREGELPKPHQWREIIRLRNMRCAVGYLAGVDEVNCFMSNYSNSEYVAMRWLWSHVILTIPDGYL